MIKAFSCSLLASQTRQILRPGVHTLRSSHLGIYFRHSTTYKPSVSRFSSTPSRPFEFPRHFPTSGFEVLPTSEKVEEETFEWYSPQEYFPVHLGQVFNSRYQVVSKLRFGGASTTWIGRDLRDSRYVTLEICRLHCPALPRVKLAYERFNAFELEGEVQGGLLDEFAVEGYGGNHHCFVTPPLTLDLDDARQVFGKKTRDPRVYRGLVHSIVCAVDFLHSDLKLIHGDLAPGHFLLPGPGDAHLKFIEELEMHSPSARKVDGVRVIHTTPFAIWHQISGEIIPTGFWSSLPGDTEDVLIGKTDLQILSYRSPEMLLNAPISYPTDIYSLGCMLWQLAEGKFLFDPYDPDEPDSGYSFYIQFKQIGECMGSPPPKLIDRSTRAELHELLFCKDGTWRMTDNPETPRTTARLEDRVTAFEGKDREEFLRLIRRCLEWDPDERITAAEPCEDPWLVDSGIESN